MENVSNCSSHSTWRIIKDSNSGIGISGVNINRSYFLSTNKQMKHVKITWLPHSGRIVKDHLTIG